MTLASDTGWALLNNGKTCSSYCTDGGIQEQEVKDVSEDSNHSSNNTDNSMLFPTPCPFNAF